MRKQILGTVEEIRTQAHALRAAETYRLSANRNAGDHAGSPPTLRKLIEHYKLKEMPMDNHEGKRRLTKLGYLSNLDNHILPRRGDYHPGSVAAIEIEEWWKSLRLAPASRAKVRNVFSMIFRHGMRWGWLDKNPVAMVRVSSKRLRRPDVLTAEEFRLLLAALPERERLMGMISATTGMRIGEVLGLKWQDIHFATCMADVLRSYSDGAIGPCKTEISEQPVPLDDSLIEGLQAHGSLRAGGYGKEACRSAPDRRCTDGSKTEERCRRVGKAGKFPDCSCESAKVPGSCSLSY